MMIWIVQTLVSAAMLMALVMAIRQPVTRAFGARIGYALWALPALRMVLPPLPGHRQLFMPVLRIAPADAGPSTVGLVPADIALNPIALPPVVADAPIAVAVNWPLVIVAIWAAGAALFFVWQMIRYRLFVGRALAGASLLSVEAGVEVWASPLVSAPVAAGIVRRRIFLPLDFLTRFTSGERRQALLHEGAHHDRRDIVANLGAIAVLASHWWNPIAYIAYRAFRADQELACDATVLDGASPQDRYAYGSALAKAGGVRMPTAACALDNGTEIKRRLKMLKQGKLAFGRRAAGMVLTVTAIGGGLVATASGSYAAAVAETVVPPAPVAEPVPPADPDDKHRIVIVRVRDRDGKTVTTTRSATTADDRAMAEASRAADRASREAVRAGRQAAEAGRRAAETGRRAGAEAARQSAEAGREAAEAGRRAAEAGRRAAEFDTRRMSIVNHGDMVRVSLEEARNGLVKHCAEAGMPVKPGEKDWGMLATCDKSVIINALENARAEIAASRDMGDFARTQATASIDQTIARMKAQQRR